MDRDKIKRFYTIIGHKIDYYFTCHFFLLNLHMK